MIRALKEVERLRAKISALELGEHEPVAIIGVGLRLPGGITNLADLWRLLAAGTDTLRPFPSERWDPSRDYDPDPEAAGKSYVNAAAFLDQVDQFDPAFFNISPREAKSIDPQHRLLLEASWEALERAGVPPVTLRNSRTGVFVGIGPSDYSLNIRSRDADAYAIMGTHTSFAAGRVAFTLGLQGPAISMDTACSSSLVALHLATQSLRSRECSLALVGGVQVMAAPDAFIQLSRTRALAPDGRSKTFSANADGYGRGEGVVVLALQRLSDAQAQGRQILAVVRGTAVNHDGASSGITAPNGTSQQKVLRAALADARLAPAAIDYVECHGTGTSLGDPIEVQALSTVYGEGRASSRPLLLGAIKTNIGHLEAASGLAGLAKILVAFDNDTLPASLHTQPPNPHIEWASLPVEVVAASRPWTSEHEPRRAGLSAFGLSGTNAHVIIEEPPPSPSEAPQGSASATNSLAVPLLLSARSEAALSARAAQLRSLLEMGQQPSLEPLARALALRCSHFEHRAAIVEAQATAAITALDELARGEPGRKVALGYAKSKPKLAILFTGQGAQRLGMGRELYRRFSAYATAFDAICTGFSAKLSRPLAEVVFAEPSSDAAALIDQTEFTQAALFAVEVALYRLIESWGIQPDVLVGHSIGELSAAHVAGVLDLDDAITLVAARGRLMQALPGGGAMVSVVASEAEVTAMLAAHPGASLAALNGPMSTVVSGDERPVMEIAEHFKALGRKVQRLQVSHAFHSHHMEPMLAEFSAVAATLRYHAPELPIISNVSGRLARAGELQTPSYWVQHVREPVRFVESVRTLETQAVQVALELGPHGVLSSMAADCLSDDAQGQVLLRSLLRRDRDELETLHTALAALHCRGVDMNWQPILGQAAAAALELPTYPFQRQRYWLSAKSEGRSGRLQSDAHYELAGHRVELPDGSAIHEVEVGPALQGYLGDHIVYDHIVVPGAFYLAVLLAVGESLWPGGAIELRDVEFVRALTFVSPTDRTTLTIHLSPDPDTDSRLCASLLTRDAVGGWLVHARGSVGPTPATALPELVSVPTERVAWAEAEATLEQRLAQVQIAWGPRWWWVRETHTDDGKTIYGRFVVPDEVPTDDAPVAAGLIDNSFALVSWTSVYASSTDETTPRLPYACARVVWYGHHQTPSHARLISQQAHASELVSDITFFDEAGDPLAHIEGFEIRKAPADRFLPSNVELKLFTLEWSPVDPPASVEPKPWVLVGTGANTLAAVLSPTSQAYPKLTHIGPSDNTRVVFALFMDMAETPGALVNAALEFVQAWLSAPEHRADHLVIGTRFAVDASDTSNIDVAGAAVWGLVRSVQTEHPDRRITLVDLDDDEASIRALASIDGLEHPQIAIRAGRLSVPRVQRARATSTTAVGLNPEGTVLITGGTGGLGSRVARHLVQAHGVRRLLLSSRRGADSPGAKALRLELEAAGAEVDIVAADVSDREACVSLLAAIPATRPLTAIFHTAGVLDDGLVSTLDANRLARVFGPKADGAIHLDELTRDLGLAAFVLFSSVSGVLGNLGQANYAAANATLDAIAIHRRALGLAGVSLAWGPWAEVGMAAQMSDADLARMRRRGLPPLAVVDALELLDLALTRPEPVLLALDTDLRALGQRADELPHVLRGLVRVFERPTRAVTTGSLLNTLARLDDTGRQRAVLDFVRREAASILGLDDPASVQEDQAFQGLGLDSLMAVELRDRLTHATQLKLPSTVLFEHGTPNALTEHLLSLLGPALGQENSENTENTENNENLDSATRMLQAFHSAQAKDRQHDRGPRNSLLRLIRDAVVAEAYAEADALLETLTKLRSFESDFAPPTPTSPVSLTSGRGAPPFVQTYCIPSIAVPSTPLQYMRIAPELSRRALVWSVRNPGYDINQEIADSRDVFMDHHTATLARCDGELPIALVGYSAGGWVAANLARHLEDLGRPASALILLDSPGPATAPSPLPFIFRTIEHFLGGNSLHSEDDLIYQITSMNRAFQLYKVWSPAPIETPTLYVYAEGGIPLQDGLADEEIPRTQPELNWAPFIKDMTIRSVPHDHFEMIAEQAAQSADTMLTWLDEVLGGG
ncbi:Malonyl CoA-acyl carrier protein transacylase [Enhygromyxa salina]|uniref:Malonyl CoA-acyl carrier protein transacylase n=1 Tax=Enhygromyxa salina TaxID=215803 RepID=A0A0C2D5R2_9BACT|nr:Malonyl CoA-acyl carrier protein transacylase [Enhygromyxa salina]